MHIGTELPARVRGLVAQLFTRVQGDVAARGGRLPRPQPRGVCLPRG
jgi:hypothetical protein